MRWIASIALSLLPLFLLSQGVAGLSRRLAAIDSAKVDTLVWRMINELLKEPLTPTQKLYVDLRVVRFGARMQQFERAIAVGNAAISRLHGSGNDSLESAFNMQMGAAYYFMNQRIKAIEYTREAIPLAEKSNSWLLEAMCCNNLGGMLTDLRRYPQAEAMLQKAISIMNAHGEGDNPRNLMTYRVLSALYKDRKQPQRAKSILYQLMNKPAVKKDTSLMADALIYAASILLDEGKLDSALAFSEKAMVLSKNKKMFHDLINVMMLRSRVLSAVGRDKEAVALVREAYGMQVKSFSKDFDRRIGEMEVKYKTAKIRMEKLQAEENARKQKWIYIGSFVGLLLVLGAVVFAFNQRRSARQKAATDKQRLEALIEGEEKERSRIARDLHDGIVQDLAAIKLKLGATRQNEKTLHSAISDLDRATREVRDIAYQMMPVALREYGLIAALDQLLQKSLTPNKIWYDFENVNIEERLPEKIETCLYRITQELVNNIVKHSKATSVSLVLSKYQDFVTLVMEDNGKGFKEQEVKKGIGMNSLSSRLEMVNGQLKLESSEGAGTSAIIKIPLVP